MADHEFAIIAPAIKSGEYDYDKPDDSDDEPWPTWQWCIRCGMLRLNNDLFPPGPNQTRTLIPDPANPGCK